MGGSLILHQTGFFALFLLAVLSRTGCSHSPSSGSGSP